MQIDPELAYVGDFPIFQSTQPLLHPFDVRYDFTLVCNECYLQSSKGHSGYIKRGRLPHECRHDILLVRTKNDSSAQWTKIRPRNIKVSGLLFMIFSLYNKIAVYIFKIN